MVHSSPLAEKLRPKSLDEIVGQKHLLAPDAVFRRIVDSGKIPNMIFYGPSGIGKTTVARIVAEQGKQLLFKLNGTTATTADLKHIVEQRDTIDGRNGIVLYLDEIQYLNKKQQQTLLEFIEDGTITLIASTTENPYFYIYNAILSRSTVFEFKPVPAEEIEKAVERAFLVLSEEHEQAYHLGEGVVAQIAKTCGGDVRKALNAVELCWISAEIVEGRRQITVEQVSEVSQRSTMRYDRDGDSHYDILSALQKSIRGSDENASLHYLARLLHAGDLLSACRRLLVIASEDIGLAYPHAITIVKACVDTAVQLGLPEGRIPLAQATVLLATAPKSNSSYTAIDAALQEIASSNLGEIPPHLKDGHYSGAKKLGNAIGYLYSHNYPNHYVKQQFLPDELKNSIYFKYAENKFEQASKKYWEEIKGE